MVNQLDSPLFLVWTLEKARFILIPGEFVLYFLYCWHVRDAEIESVGEPALASSFYQVGKRLLELYSQDIPIRREYTVSQSCELGILRCFHLD